MTEQRDTLLIVDDDDILRTRLARAFEDRGLQVSTASCYEEAVEILRDAPPHKAVFDLKMPGRSGLDLLQEMKRLAPDTPVVLMTGYGSISNAVEAIRYGAINYVTKPADADEILAAFVLEPKPLAAASDTAYCPQSLAEAEWGHIQQVLADCGGNISEAARLLDIPRRTLQRKLKKPSV